MEVQKTQKDDYFLDITDEVCPMTFVKTKLMIERLPPGAVLAVRLRGAEPLHNVPRSVEEMGHTITTIEPLDDGCHRITITLKG